MARTIVVNLTLNDKVMEREGWEVDDIMREVSRLLEDVGPSVDSIHYEYEED